MTDRCAKLIAVPVPGPVPAVVAAMVLLLG
jgi:hypothetical protein